MKIKRLRAAREMTQAVLAKKAGLTQVHVARLESGKHDPTLGTLQRLAKALKVPVTDVAGVGEENGKSGPRTH